jgi:hypothetical protein
MSKIIDSTVQSLIDGKHYGAVLLGQFDFGDSSGPLKLNHTPQTIYWDDEGNGEVAYLGIGKLGSISTLTETNELGAVQVQFTLSGIPGEYITKAFSDDYRNRSVFLWYGILDTETYAIKGGTSGPILIYAGLTDYCDISFGQTANITLHTSSRLSDWDRARGGRYTDVYQKTYIDETDCGFKRVIPLQNVDIPWGDYVSRAGGGSTNDTSGRFRRKEDRE